MGIFKHRSDSNSGYPKYDEIDTVDEDDHVHRWGGYSRSDGRYYEGGHGEDVSKEEKEEGGRIFRKERGD